MNDIILYYIHYIGCNIAKAISDIASDFQIESIPCLVTNNTANMAVAAKEA